MVYNNSGLVVYVMTHNDPKTVKSEEEKSTLDWRDLRGLSFGQTFFPRIIREFDDGVDEKPMAYWRCTQ
jgi:hypothetical protein